MNSTFSKAWIALRKYYSDSRLWIVVIAIGVWMIVLQNFGVFSKSSGAQSVYVVGGDIDANVSGSVEVDNTVPVYVEGGDVDVSGSSVEVEGSVWVNGGTINTW